MWTDDELAKVFVYIHSRAIGLPEKRPAPQISPDTLPLDLNDISSAVRDQLGAAITAKSSDVVEAALGLALLFDVPLSVYFDLSCQLVTEDWHISQEDIIRLLQDAEDARAIPFLRTAIDLKPRLEHLAHDDYGSYYKKCLWALSAIGTPDAIAVIRDCVNSEIAPLREEAEYRLSKIQGPGARCD
ncbi:hypothetical protein [Rhizobium sp. LjRoot254]|uniref:hypothetical protein n=1 Tax=Rhizobium sp. LjRoot254 TaxID=3342297 RepID=UPI003ECE6B95